MHNRKLSPLTRLAAAFSLSLSLLPGPLNATEPPQRSAEAKVFHVKGVFLQTKGPDVAVIDHETIPDHMPAMVMPFHAARPQELGALSAGDEIVFDYVVDGLQSWVENVTPTGKKRLTPPGAAAKEPEERRPLKVGDVLPDREFKDELGNPVHLSDSRGKAVALTFVFTRCAMPEACPKMMRNFSAVSQALKDDPEAPANWQLLTISFDSFHDTPETMKAFGEAYQYDPANWSLLSSDSCCTIKDIATDVDLRYTDDPTKPMEHNLRTVVLDPAGRITRLFTDETWTVDELASAIREAAKKPAQ
jgi:protein SCO1/2